MSPERPSQPDHSQDEPLDAIVYAVHPALLPRQESASAADDQYPYGAHQGFCVLRKNPDWVTAGVDRLIWLIGLVVEFLNRPPEFVVPPRFGLSAILGMTTALAILFGCMHWMDTEPVWYLFYGVQSIVICIVQMFHGKSPRKASAVAGAIMGPLFLLGTAWFTWDVPAAGVACLMVAAAPLGAFLGYLNGTCAAGIFLVMDKLEQYFKPSIAGAPSAAPSPAIPAS